MAIEKFNVKATWKEKLLIETEARGHKVIVDEPVSLGGTDQGSNPVELVLSALGACQAIVIQTYAKQFGINIEDLKIELEGELDTDGFLNKSDVRPGYSHIKSKFVISTDAPKEKLETFIQFVENHCPVGDTIKNPVHLTSKIVVEKPVK